MKLWMLLLLSIFLSSGVHAGQTGGNGGDIILPGTKIVKMEHLMLDLESGFTRVGGYIRWLSYRAPEKPYLKQIFKGNSIFNILQTVEFDYKLESNCIDVNGDEKDATSDIDNVKICFSMNRLQKKLTGANHESQLLGLLLHELFHLAGVNEIQSQVAQIDFLNIYDKLNIGHLGDKKPLYSVKVPGLYNCIMYYDDVNTRSVDAFRTKNEDEFHENIKAIIHSIKKCERLVQKDAKFIKYLSIEEAKFLEKNVSKLKNLLKKPFQEITPREKELLINYFPTYFQKLHSSMVNMMSYTRSGSSNAEVHSHLPWSKQYQVHKKWEDLHGNYQISELQCNNNLRLPVSEAYGVNGISIHVRGDINSQYTFDGGALFAIDDHKYKEGTNRDAIQELGSFGIGTARSGNGYGIVEKNNTLMFTPLTTGFSRFPFSNYLGHEKLYSYEREVFSKQFFFKKLEKGLLELKVIYTQFTPESRLFPMGKKEYNCTYKLSKGI